MAVDIEAGMNNDTKVWYMTEFLKEKKLTKEYEAFVKDCLEKKKDALLKLSVGDIPFDFSGRLSRCCYECSGHDFEKGGSLNYILENELGVSVYDPKTEDEWYAKKIKQFDMSKYSTVKDLLTEDEFKTVFDRFMGFVNQENDTFNYYDCEEFGFDGRNPSETEIREWFGSLITETTYRDSLLDEMFELTF